MHDATNPLTVKSVYDSLKAAGYPRPYIERLLPAWWDNGLFKTSAGAFQFALILKQRLGLDVSFAQDGNLTIQAKTPNARFKRRSGTKEGELHVAASLGAALARLAVFCAKYPYLPLSADPIIVGKIVRETSTRSYADFAGLLDMCWKHGIPVLFLQELPRATKRVTGMAVNISGRPAIILGYKNIQHARQLFILAHELGHIVCGHLGENELLIDEDISDVSERLVGAYASKKDEEERQADAFALALLRNGHGSVLKSLGRPDSAAALASSAAKVGKSLGIDPGHLILSYAKENDDWMRANQALGYFSEPISAISLLQEAFLANTSLDLLSEENKEHLKAIQGFAG